MLQICGYEEPVGFLVQIVYKKAYGDENTTFEPLNLWTRERLHFSLAFSYDFAIFIIHSKCSFLMAFDFW